MPQGAQARTSNRAANRMADRDFAHPIARFIRARFTALAHPRNAKLMAAYMKTDMPFHGINKPDRLPIDREAVATFPLRTRREYRDAVMALWNQPFREEKYSAIFLAKAHPQFITAASLPLYRRMIIDGAWWDLVDDIAARLVGRIVLDNGEPAQRKMDAWIEDQNLWIRRSAIICRLSHKEETDE